MQVRVEVSVSLTADKVKAKYDVPADGGGSAAFQVLCRGGPAECKRCRQS